jgi:NodT family efflux transporter outer membrane factor (OMF) lipoprotein
MVRNRLFSACAPINQGIKKVSLAKFLSTTASATVIGLTLSACAVGPDFKRPAAPTVSGFTPNALPTETASIDVPGGGAQKFLIGQNISAQWWTLFQSPALNALVDEAIKNNPNLQAAEAALRQADENLKAQRSILFPAVDGNFNVARQKSYGNFGGGGAVSIPAYTTTSASVSVSYAIDLFGASRRALEGTRAQTEQARFQMEAAHLTLISNVIITAVQQAALRAQVAATQSILDAQEQQLSVMRQQLELGGLAEADVLTQLTGVAQTRAQLPTLQKQLDQTTNQLLALVGRFPDQVLTESLDLAQIQLPANLPVSLPSQVVEQRPDIRASEANLHTASAAIGLATARMLPQIALNGSYGTSASAVDQLFAAGTGIWSLTSNLTQPIFRGGELLHRKRAAVAAYDVAAAQYRGTVLAAFQNVSDTLRALQVDAEALKAQVEAERAASENLQIAQTRFEGGSTSFLTLLDAQRSYQQTRIALVQAQATRYADTAALFAALGGGWWNRSQETAANTFEDTN